MMSKDAQTPEWLAVFLALVLPAPERTDYARLVKIDVPWWSMIVGVAEFVGAAVYFVHDGLNFLRGSADRNMSSIMETDPRFFQSRENSLAYMWSGSFNVLEWLSQPFTLFLISIVLVGMMRLVAFATSRDASGEFFVWAFARATQLVNRQRRSAATKVRFGPRRPDRLLREPGCDLLLLTSSRQPEWNEDVTIEIGERFYNVIELEERRLPGETWTWYAYRLREQPDNAIIRRLLRYEPDLEPA